jgi:PadR family transcriptional regulator PadR
VIAHVISFANKNYILHISSSNRNIMKDTNLGAFEELVLLVVGSLADKAYGVAIKDALEEQTGRAPSIGSLHSALYRLEDKGYLKSTEGGATTERGGRRKKFYRLSASGRKALEAAHELRMVFSSRIPGLKLNN